MLWLLPALALLALTASGCGKADDSYALPGATSGGESNSLAGGGSGGQVGTVGGGGSGGQAGSVGGGSNSGGQAGAVGAAGSPPFINSTCPKPYGSGGLNSCGGPCGLYPAPLVTNGPKECPPCNPAGLTKCPIEGLRCDYEDEAVGGLGALCECGIFTRGVWNCAG